MCVYKIVDIVYQINNNYLNFKLNKSSKLENGFKWPL